MDYKIVYSKKRKKRISLKIDEKGNLLVYCPFFCNEKYILSLIEKNKTWFEKNAQKLQDSFYKRNYLENEVILFFGEKYFLKKIAGNEIFIKDDYLYFPQKFLEKEKENLRKFYQENLYPLIKTRINFYAQKYNFSFFKFKISKAEKRWGSCSYKNVLNFSYKLCAMPKNFIDYVIVHELAHTKEKNHSSKFWQIVKEIMPNFQAVKSETKNYAKYLNI